MNNGKEIVDLYSRYVMTTYSQSLVLVRGKGSRVWDADGKAYLDFLAGISVLNVGHCHPKVVRAIQSQAESMFPTFTTTRFNRSWPRNCRTFPLGVSVSSVTQGRRLTNA